MSSDNSSLDDDEYYNAKNLGKNPKAGKEVVFETPVDETPVDETPVDETPVDEVTVVETPVDDDEYYNAKDLGKKPKAGKEVEDDGDY
jgi:topoisomerase IA-like protein